MVIILHKINTLIMLFFIYSFLGWLIEVLFCYIKNRKFINRGFLYGPYLPIYGFGGIFVCIIDMFIHNPFLLFIISFFICGLLEYSTSLAMEKIFNKRWWDYANKEFNLEGRICLEYLFVFGIMSLITIYYLNPFFLKIIRSINKTYIILFLIIIGFDLTITLKIKKEKN